MILNLLENARDALALRAGGGGRIAVATALAAGGRAVALSIEDNGPGIAPEVKKRLFTPYFTTKQKKGGTGLGLAIVHRVVTDHGGSIAVDDAPTGGARFVIELPVASGARG
jgi:signal transduction histidine kinase